MLGRMAGPGSNEDSPHVVVRWDAVADAEPLVREVVRELTGQDPWRIHHLCPTCGSIEHGRPSVEADVFVSIAHCTGLTIVAVSPDAPVGVDVEPAERAESSWVAREARGKAYGVGLVGDTVTGTAPEWVVDVDVPGHVAALVVLSPGRPEVQAGPRRTARSRTATPTGDG